MQRLERAPEITALLIQALQQFEGDLWTALPCIVDTFDPTLQTCTAKPATEVMIRLKDGAIEWVQMPLLVDVPVCFPSGGGFTLTFPLAAGDEVLVIFSTLCIDSWWQSGGVGNRPPDLRMHDLSDGFAIPQPRSKPRSLSGFSTNSAQLRSDDGATKIEILNGAVNITAATVNITAATAVNMTTDHLLVTGQIRTTEDITIKFGTAGAHTLTDVIDTYDIHTHKGVTPGAGDSGVTNQPL